jgi:hypothetical protein
VRLLRPLLAVAALVAAAAAVPADARVARPIELTSTTIVTTAHSGYLDVVVPVDARLSARVDNNPDVDIDGTGRYVGVWLQRIQATYTGQEDGLTSTRLPNFLGAKRQTWGSYVPTGQCVGTPAVMPLHYDCTGLPAPQTILLHEGPYRLTVLADDSPLTITLTLHGLDDGVTRLTPAHQLASMQRPLPQRDGVDNKLITYGATAPMRGSVAGWVMASVKSPVGATMRGESVCARTDAGDPPALAYGPHCPDGEGGGYYYTVSAGGQSYGLMGGFATTGSDDGDLGLGGSFGNSDGVTLGQTLGVWMKVPS